MQKYQCECGAIVCVNRRWTGRVWHTLFFPDTKTSDVGFSIAYCPGCKGLLKFEELKPLTEEPET